MLVGALAITACEGGNGIVDPDPDPDPDPPAETEEISGDIQQDLTLSSDVRYRVVGDVRVRGATLTIEPGTWIEFEQETGLEVMDDGRISADGTEADPIRFTGVVESPGSWDGISFRDSTHPSNLLDWVIIEYGGRQAFHGSTEPANLTVGRSLRPGSITLTNSTLRHSGGYGLYLHDNGALPGSGSNTFTENASGPAGLFASVAHYLDGGSAYTGNGDSDHVAMTGDRVGDDVTWQALDVPYLVTGDAEVNDARLTIEAGAAFLFDGEASLEIINGGVIRAEGTADDPILFSGTQETAGWWQGIHMRDSTSPENLLQHVIIEHAGRSAFHGSTEPAGLTVGRSLRPASVTLVNSTLRNNEGHGAYVHSNGGLPDSEDNTFTGNAAGAIMVWMNNAHHLDAGSSFTGNGDNDFAWVRGDRLEADATWQALDVPYGIRGDAEVRNEASLTIDPGAVVAFDAEASLTFHDAGAIRIIGTADDPIVFTGTQETAGWWQGIDLRDSTHPNNAMEHVVIEYGGRSAAHSSTEPANLTVGRSLREASISITDSTIRHSGGYGLYVHGNSSVNGDACSVNDFSGNAGPDCSP